MSHQEETIGTTERAQAELVGQRHINKGWRIVGVVFLCFTASFLGAWLFLATGLVKPDFGRTITQNRDQIVSQQGEVFTSVYKKVNPSTVAITTESTVALSGNLRFAQPQTEQGAGSGIIVSKDGYILTNKHVVPDGTTNVSVVLADGTQYDKVRVVGGDPFNDIAFLKIDGVTHLTPAQFGDSNQVQPGQQVVAIGNALGIFRNSVTAGIISGVGRPIRAQDDSSGSSEQLEDLFQTDAAINPGNSGGPLVDLAGNVIGINTAVSSSGQAIGFAIPINDAKKLINSVVQNGKIIKPYLGVRYITLTPEIAKALKTQTSGAMIAGSGGQSGVIAGSPAAKAGLRDGNVITKVSGQQIDAQHSLSSRLSQLSPGDKVQLTVIRDGKEQIVAVTLDEYKQ